MKQICMLLLVLVLSGCAVAAGSPAPTSAPGDDLPTAPVQPAPGDTAPPLPTFTTAPTATISPVREEDQFAFEQNQRLARGVNFGNALEAPNEGEWGMTIQESYFDLIQAAGFTAVRVPIRWTAHTQAEPPYTIDPAFFDRIDWVVEQALKRDLAVIVNLHHFEGDIYEHPSEHKERFLVIWKQISQHYADYPDGLFFELFNEPYGTFSTTNSWNALASETIAVVRNTNPKRTIILGPGQWNSYRELYGLQLPETDRNLIVTFHYYDPFQFTHQGAEWAEGSDAWLGATWGSQTDQKNVQDAFAQVRKWADFARRPIFLGEFGAYNKADMDSRVKWTTFVAREAEKQGFSWAYWEFGAGFGVYDRDKEAWNDGLLKALIP